MNVPILSEVNEKRRRVLEYLDSNGYGAMIIGRRDNFSWFTDGGNNRVIVPDSSGFGVLLITMDKVYLIAQVMDGRRIMEEELQGIDVEYVPLYWYECSREQKALELAKGLKVVSDVMIDGADYLPDAIYRLHYPLTENEIEKLRWLGRTTEEAILNTSKNVRPGMTEHEVEAMLLYECAKHNIQCDVLLVGSDERIFKYRHPNPSDKKIDKYVLLHPAARKWGLHVNVTRMMYIGGSIPEEIERKYDAVSMIEAAVISMCEPGTSFSQILEVQKKLYKELGYEDEWKNHYPGGITGYMVADPTLSKDPANIVVPNQAYDWFITITGVKVEELSINKGSGQEILSVSGQWPVKQYTYNGKTFALPKVLEV